MILEQLSSQDFWFLLILGLWILPWKGIALWRAARRSEKWWFVVLLVLNTLAVLEIIYIFVFSRNKRKFFPEEN
ncbi:DUF5652 family protein [Patescibacteria group bacterium]|nr:DUF5652 family protein [Patescibacteria group bacterium]